MLFLFLCSLKTSEKSPFHKTFPKIEEKLFFFSVVSFNLVAVGVPPAWPRCRA